MNNYRIPRPIQTAALLGLFAVAFCGSSLAAATAPTLTKIVQKDTNRIITMATGYAANKVAFDSLSNAYVTDTQIGAIYRFNKNGHLARATSAVYGPLGVAAYNKYDAVANKTITTIFAGGIKNDNRTGWMLGQDGAAIGYLKRLPSDVSPVYFGVPNDMAVDASGNVYVADSGNNVVQEFDGNGILVKAFGPYPANDSAKYFDAEIIGGLPYYRTRHTMTIPTGVVVANGEMYVSFSERVDYLTLSSDTMCAVSMTDSACSPDTENSWKKYTGATDAYNTWLALGAAQVVAVMDMNGNLKRKITVYPFVKFRSSGYSFYQTDAAVDNNGRLYVASNSGMKVFDAAIDNPKIDVASTALSVTQSPSGSVPAGSINGVAYDGAYNRLMISAGNIVTLFGIDAYTTPVDGAPGAPGLISPISSYARSLSPLLTIRNATDPEDDPLTYGYEITEVGGTSTAASASGLPEGTNGVTSMPVNSTLKEMTRYRWRAQSFDGNLSTWSGWAEFCVKVANHNPGDFSIISPLSASDSVSPFGSTLAWNASIDKDCYDTVSYVVEVSGDHGVVTSNVAGTSIGVGNFAKELTNGKVYNWRVKAVDNDGGASNYANGSFTYKTTVVKFNSDQAGAKVYIDGNYGYSGTPLGAAPLEAHGIGIGTHFVAFMKAGYEPVYKIINVSDPLLNGGALTVAAGASDWATAKRISPSSTGAPINDSTGTPIKMSDNSTPFVMDYNNDGVKDLIVGGGDGKVYLYNSQKQTVNGTETIVPLVYSGAIQFYSPDTKTSSDINVGSRAVPFAVDYNNDGKKDLLVGSGDGRIYLYQNNGTDDAPLFYTGVALKDVNGNDIKAVSNSAPFVVDYNNDGRKDLVLGGSEGTLTLYLNVGSDASPVFEAAGTIKADNAEINAGVGADSKAFFTDWNGDGKKDLVVGGNALHLYLNVGTDDSPDFRSTTGLQDWIKAKKRERGNREFIPYLGYVQDLSDLISGASADVAPFVVNWDGTPARDIVEGAADGSMVVHITAK